MIWRFHHDDLQPAAVEAWLASLDHLVVPEDRWRHRANCWRWLMLAFHGGVWLDNDASLRVPAETLGDTWTAALGSRACCCAMGYPAGHPAPVAMLARIAAYTGPQAPAPVVSGDRVYGNLCPPSVRRLQITSDAGGRTYPGVVDHRWETSWTRS